MNWRLIRYIDSCVGIPFLWFLGCLAPFRNRNRYKKRIQEPKTILLIKFWGIGNLFMLLPTIESLRLTWPDASVDFLTLEGNREALAMTDAVDHIFSVDTAHPLQFLASLRRTARLLRERKYDLIVDFEQFARFSALMTYHTGAVQTIGFATKNQHRHYLYTDAIPYNNDLHITQSFYALMRHAGVTPEFQNDVKLHRIEQIQKQGRELLANFGMHTDAPVVVMHIGTSENFCERRWPPQQYAALADLLMEKYGLQIFMTGLPEETFLIALARQTLRKSSSVVDLGGQLSFEQYFALLSVADLVISADTAAVHLASVLNVPVAGLYGPNTPQLYGPWGTNGLALYAGFSCSPCITNFNSKINTCRHPDGRGACMKALSVAEVFAALEEKYLAPHASSRLRKLGEQDS